MNNSGKHDVKILREAIKRQEKELSASIWEKRTQHAYLKQD